MIVWMALRMMRWMVQKMQVKMKLQMIVFNFRVNSQDICFQDISF